MGKYKENPKTKGSGILCAIPQEGRCPMGCADCFFNSGRSFLEPLEENLPNMPDPQICRERVVRVNDGLDSNVQRDLVVQATDCYPLRFFNTSIPDLDFPGPVVLTVNPGDMTDSEFHEVNPVPQNLMFVRVRVNTWNLLNVVFPAARFYTSREVPVVLTFMAYYQQEIPEDFQLDYTYRKRTTNSYWAITTDAWRRVMSAYRDNPWVHSCGKLEGGKGTTACRHCGNCLREFFATRERMNTSEGADR